jgi:cellulose biosynthesis protein BcsQ
MNVITLASRKGGVGKSTLTAHLAAYAHLMGHRCMVVDADPQGSLTLWHSMRADNGLVLQNAASGINRLVASALAGLEHGRTIPLADSCAYYRHKKRTPWSSHQFCVRHQG